MIFATRLVKARTDAGLSQKDLAKKVGFDRSNITNYENGYNEPTLFNAVCIADALGVSIDWLEGRTDCKEVNK